MDIRLYPDAGAVAQAAAGFIVDCCAQAIEQHGYFHWALAGGTTPILCYERLRGMAMPWSKVHVYFGDERCLPRGHPERNDSMAERALLAHVDVPVSHIHRVAAELGAEAAATAYSAVLRHVRLDLALLGMGEDGHTASLFPASSSLKDERLAVPVFDAPKSPPERVSMGYTMLGSARERLLLVTGAGKREALERIRAGAQLPAARLEPSKWFVDAQAAGTSPV